MLYKLVTQDIFKNKQIKESGGHIGVPIPFPKLAEYVPIIEPGHSIGILGATGSGKSRFTRWMFVYHVYKFYKETGYPVHILLFPLEDNKEKAYRSILCHYLFDLYGIYITLQELDSKGKVTLPDFVQEKIIEAEAFFAEFEDVVTIVDGMNEPTQLFNYCVEYAMENGVVENYMVGNKKQQRYVSPIHTIIIADNMSNVDIEAGAEDERLAIVKFCKTYARGRLCNFFRHTVVQVLQQDFASERQSFNGNGETIIAKLEPSLAGVGDSKTITRSMHLVFGIFHPARFGLIQYPLPNKKDLTSVNKCYRLDILGNRFRSLSVLKANDSDFGLKIAFNFNAVNEVMEELPAADSPEMEHIYKRIIDKGNLGFSKIKPTQQIKIENNADDEEELPF